MTTIVGTTAQTSETVEQMPTYRHGDIIAAIIAAMRPYALSHRLGRVFAPQTTYHIAGLPDREPDVTFVRQDRLPADPNVDPDIPPDLAGEVVSRSDTFGAVSINVRQYLDAGVRMVWMINPDLRTVDVYQPSVPRLALNEGDLLAADPVIPGFSMPVAALFDW